MKPIKKSIVIRDLEPEDAGLVADFVRSQPPEYLRFFFAFSFEERAIREMLSATREDIYAGVFWQGKLIGVSMLRGWDEGYKIPAFGVLIDEKYRGGNLMKLTLDTAKVICRFLGIKQIMAKLHPENISPRGARQWGFVQTGFEEKTGNIIYHLDL